MIEKKADIIIIGGGAAGMMAAAGAAGEGSKALILEKMPRPGRKIMITGKGRCNITNMKPWSDFSRHIHPKANFLKPSFFNLTPEKLAGLLEENGLATTLERGDRLFPASNKAADVVDTLSGLAKNGAEMLCGKEVTDILHENGEFTLSCSDGDTFTCKRLVICTGGLSYPATGSTGDGYRWAEAFGHKIKQCLPSLTAIVPKGYKQVVIPGDGKGHIARENPLSETGGLLCGNQLKNISLTLLSDGNVIDEEFGDIDFTDGGIEGPVGFKVSRKCVNAIVNGAKVSVKIDLKPAVSQESINARISNLWKEISEDRRSGGKPYKDKLKILLAKLMPSSLIQAFVRCNPNISHKNLGQTLKKWKFDIEGYVGYERCVITSGGISLEDVTAKTLESKRTPGLYFAGEILDLDGDTGGYNLHTAFSTGYLAGQSAAKSL